MTAVIVGLVAVVLLVLLVVALGMRSMNRRESALSAERIKAMAENKGPKPRRPAEETFFESFPKGFDAFEEPEKQRPAPRPAPRPGGRQAARPAQRGGKQPAAARGKRGVDEWGGADDYDDDYWSRVRADDGGFGGTIAARMATPRPVDETAGAAGAAAQAADPDAATVQAPLPARPGRARRADADEPVLPAAPVSASALADQKTVTFSAPTPDLLDVPAAPAGSPSTGPFDASRTTGPFDSPAVSGAPASPAGDPFATAAGTQSGAPGASTRRPSRSGRSSRAAARRAAAAAAASEAGQAGGSYDSQRATGPFPSSASAASYGTQPGADPLGMAASTGPFGAPAYDTPAGTGPFASQGGTGSHDGRYDTAPSSPIPATGSFAAGAYDPARTSGAFEAAAPTASSADSLADPASRSTGGSFDAWAASYDTPRSDAYDSSRAATGPFRAADASPSYPPNPAGSGAAVTGPDAGGATDPGWPVAGSYPPVPASAPTTGSSSWPGARDVLDDPEPPHSASSWPNAETYQTPAYDGYSSTYPAEGGYPAASAPSPAAPATPSYEVSTGWATIDASDTVTGSAPGTASPYESAGYDAPSGQSQYGYDRQQQQGYGGAQPSWPEQNAGGSWPSYDEVPGDTPTSAGGRRRGSRHRDPESDYPDYYR
ncbi:hypothetical protein [Microbispora sp. NBRC 16548]|uniref:hypothetical protein n=1 Tax=Microbispora sp. NBRC 16548 TaxID=3030994 RepID=UPI0024A58938|nr:hypothetical protein [Microbispora sp. NBRC 16548]GLX03472.1 hypothetical protein Misp03_03990 [Microbispora sp. NBRC 16548]